MNDVKGSSLSDSKITILLPPLAVDFSHSDEKALLRTPSGYPSPRREIIVEIIRTRYVILYNRKCPPVSQHKR